MAKKHILSPPETFFKQRTGEFMDPGLIPIPQVTDPGERALMEAEFLRRAKVAELQIKAEELRLEGQVNPTSRTAEKASPRITLLPVKDLEVSPWSARPAPLDGEALQNLAYAISREGIRSPLHVYPLREKPGCYAILDGQRRFTVARSLGLQEVPVILHETPAPEKAYALSYMLSETGEKPGLLDNALMWHRLVSEKVVTTHEELALRLGVSKSSMSLTMQFFKLSERCRDFLLEHPGLVTYRVLTSLVKAETRYGPEAVVPVLQSMDEGTTIEAALKRLGKGTPVSRYQTAFSREPIIQDGVVVGMARLSGNRLIVELTGREFDETRGRQVLKALNTVLASSLD